MNCCSPEVHGNTSALRSVYTQETLPCRPRPYCYKLLRFARVRDSQPSWEPGQRDLVRLCCSNRRLDRFTLTVHIFFSFICSFLNFFPEVCWSVLLGTDTAIWPGSAGLAAGLGHLGGPFEPKPSRGITRLDRLHQTLRGGPPRRQGALAGEGRGWKGSLRCPPSPRSRRAPRCWVTEPRPSPARPRGSGGGGGGPCLCPCRCLVPGLGFLSSPRPPSPCRGRGLAALLRGACLAAAPCRTAAALRYFAEGREALERLQVEEWGWAAPLVVLGHFEQSLHFILSQLFLSGEFLPNSQFMLPKLKAVRLFPQVRC